MKALEANYGSWTVIGTVESFKKPCGAVDRKVMCRCKCGLERMVRAGDLRNGKSQRCNSCSSKRERPGARKLRPSRYKCSTKIGDPFGSWSVIENPVRADRGENQGGIYSAKCRCVCGVERYVLLANLRNGTSTSCGCMMLRSDEWKRLKHIWLAILKRCYNQDDDHYKWYGARGIGMCDEWRNNFESFVNWCIANGSRKGLQIDRRENNQGYSPENCRFVTSKVNCRNTRRNVMITAFGETKCVAEWAEDPRCVCSQNTLYHRFFDYGLTPEEALTMPCESGIAFEKRSR